MAIGALIVGLAVVVVIRLLIGRDSGGGLVLAWPDEPAIAAIRLDRALAAAAVGACLGLAGVFLQALLRNPLASPDLIGASSGASLAVVLHAAVFGAAGAWIAPLPPTIGALGALAIVYVLAQRRGVVSPVALILVGVMVATVAGAVVTLVVSLMPDRGLSLSGWLLGSIRDDAGRWPVVLAGSVVVVAAAVGVWQARSLDLLTLDDAEAASLGVRLARTRLWIFVLAGVLSAAAVIVAGPIGFVGLVAAHVVRAWIGPTHRTLVPASALLGAALVVAADVVARLIDTGSGRLPTGVITALVGGPVFVLMLRRVMPRQA